MIPAYEASVELTDAVLLDMLTNLDARLEYVDCHAWTTVRAMRLVEEVRRLRRGAVDDARRIGELEARLAGMERARQEFVEGRTIDWRERGSGV